ncbi:MAG: GNAT family N-acetyltransferase [Bacteroidales bacterium]|jgi:hypothetical protein|nr:GNAT family N-acetyltransferase [Bacteroidales bacterium]
MKNVIAPVDKRLLEKELTRDKFVRKTNRVNNDLFIVTAHDSPHVMQEIGRLRELSFRSAGGGTGETIDIDHYDVADNPYKQLIVWDPVDREILGGYRFHVCDDSYVSKNGEINLATAELFHFSDSFIRNYLPHTIELGRSFVQPAYQSTNRFGKGLYALDNLWDGLGALVVQNPGKKYFLGKVTMYTSFNTNARNMILFFLDKYFGDREKLIFPFDHLALQTDIDTDAMKKIFTGNNYREDYKILFRKVRSCGENIPPLVNSYMNLSPSMRTFGTAINPYFGEVEETGLIITINEIYGSKVQRHISPYRQKERMEVEP